MVGTAGLTLTEHLHMPDTVCSVPLSLRVLTAALRFRDYSHPQFTDGEMTSRDFNNLPRITKAVSRP